MDFIFAIAHNIPDEVEHKYYVES